MGTKKKSIQPRTSRKSARFKRNFHGNRHKSGSSWCSNNNNVVHAKSCPFLKTLSKYIMQCWYEPQRKKLHISSVSTPLTSLPARKTPEFIWVVSLCGKAIKRPFIVSKCWTKVIWLRHYYWNEFNCLKTFEWEISTRRGRNDEDSTQEQKTKAKSSLDILAMPFEYNNNNNNNNNNNKNNNNNSNSSSSNNSRQYAKCLNHCFDVDVYALSSLTTAPSNAFEPSPRYGPWPDCTATVSEKLKNQKRENRLLPMF